MRRSALASVVLYWTLTVLADGTVAHRSSGWPDYDTCMDHGQRIAIRLMMKGHQNVSYSCNQLH
jgi:hypothetical protein